MADNGLSIEVTIKSGHMVDFWDHVDDVKMIMNLNGALEVTKVIDGAPMAVAYYAPDAWLKFEVKERYL